MEFLIALDALGTRYGARPSEIILGDVDSFGFDLAVAWTAMHYRKNPIAASQIESQEIQTEIDPITWFKEMGQSGWNQS